MSDIETNLNQEPYFDDYDEDKNFHRVLFRPGYAVQARELTQLQTMLQKQIGRLGNEVFIDGIIVTGGGLTTSRVEYVKLRDKDANNSIIRLSDFFSDSALTKIANATVSGQTSGVEGKLVFATTGSEAAAPDFFTIHVHYTNSGTNNTTKRFIDNEVLVLRHSSNSGFIIAANTITANSTGIGLKANIQEGIAYHKENFIKFSAQQTIVDKYNFSANAFIGLATTESIIDSNQDQTLLDNATGATNFTAPGANRLKITATLTAKPFGFANTSSFFRVAEIVNGNPVEKPLDRNLSTLGKFVAERVYDSSGNFAVTPFNIRVREHLNKTGSLGRLTSAEGGDKDKLMIEIEPGIAYVNGEKIKTTSTEFVEIDKATDFETTDSVVVGQQFGNYVFAKQVVGIWDFQGLRTISLRDSVQAGYTSEQLGARAAQGSEIGTARIRGIQYDAGTPGTPSGRYRIYLFDVQMNSGKSFSQVKGLHVTNTTGPNAMADLVGSTLRETGLNSLVLPTGITAVKQFTDSSGVNDNQFVYRTEKTVNFATNGTATVTANTTHAGATETMNETGSPLSNTEERNIIVVARETVETSPHTGTVSQSGNTVTGSGTSFTSAYQVNDFIKVGTEDPTRITAIDSATQIRTVASATVGSGAAHATVFPTGYHFDLSGNGTITSTSTSHTINLQQANLASTFSASVYFNRLRSSAVQTAKTVKKDVYVHINTGSHSASKTGPWPLGVSDAYKLTAVYQGTNTSVTTSDTDVTKHFELDNGQKDAFYDTSYLKKRATSSLSTTNSGLLVKFSYFGRDRSEGIGFLNVDSYPIDDANTANTTAITTQEIPLFVSPTSGVTRDLRDSVDFRPYKANTCEPTTTGTVSASPTNPAASSTYDIDTDGSHMPTPDENFQADIQYYLPRRDRIVVNPVGTFTAIKGNPDLNPRTPDLTAPNMSLATLDIPPYPSLSPFYAASFGRLDQQVTMKLDNNRRYTMADLRAVDSRVKSLEYYSSLNLLENITLNKQIFNDSTATDRFKNGFFVDNFSSLKFSDTKNPNLRSAIDVDSGVLRPSFKKNYIPMNTALVDTASLDSTNFTKTGDTVSLSYTHRELQKQPYASKKRNLVQELMFNWEGTVVLQPSMDNLADVTTLPELQVDFDGVFDASLETLRAAGVDPNGVTFGDFRTTSSRINGLRITTTQQREVTTTTLGSVTEEISLGTSVNKVSMREFMRSRSIRFTGNRMRPNTRVFPFFDKEKVGAYCTPTNSSFVATGAEGDSLTTDSTGTVYGLFRIPNDSNLKFRQGTKRFELMDVLDRITGEEIITTSAHGDYTSLALDVDEQARSVNVKLPQLSQQTRIQTRQTVINLPPPPPPRPRVRPPIMTCFVAGTQVRMADGTDKNIEDVQIGEVVVGQDGAENKVLAFDHHPLGERKLIGLNGGGKFMTPEHPLYTQDGWKSYSMKHTLDVYPYLEDKMVGDLEVGDKIQTVTGDWVEVKSIETYDDDKDRMVYNFFLDGNNTYHANGLLAHNRSCFVSGTMVTLEDGTRTKIEGVKIGDRLVGQDGKINQVLEYDHPMLNGRELIGLNNNGPFMTPEHPLYTQDGWKSYRLADTLEAYPHMESIMAGELQVGDKIKTESGDWTEITSIEVFDKEPEQQVYNFILDGNNTYFADGLLAHNRDPLAQSFDVVPAISSDGVYVTKVDLFFAKKHPTLPVTLQIREMDNGFPTETVVAEKTLYPASVNVSSNASTATTFVFDDLVFLNTAQEYTLVAVPAGNNDQYQLWVAQMGGEDVLLPNTLITKNQATGVLFSSSNDKTWKPYQDEDMKYTIHCAKFTTNTSTIYLDSDEMEYFTIDNLSGNDMRVGETVIAESVLTFANNQTISVGNIIQSKHAANNNSTTHAAYANGVVRQIVTSGSGSVTVKVDPFGTFSTTATGNTNNLYVGSTWVGNTSAYTANTAQGTVSFYYGVANRMHLESSAGGFSNGYIRGQSSGGSVRVTSVDDLTMNVLVPKIPQIVHGNTNITWAARTVTSGGTISSSYKNIQLGTDNHFTDNEKAVFSTSNESSLTAVNGSKKSLLLKGTMSTKNDYVSPIIDVSRANMLAIENVINNDSTGEENSAGNATMRYISKSVTLADGQDAEDMSVFIDAFKPSGTDIKVYARILHSEDPEALEDKEFTLMTQVTSSNTISSGIDGSDIKEFEFAFTANTNGEGFLSDTTFNQARLNSANSNVVGYMSSDGSQYGTYKTFQLKIVMTSSGTHIVPLVDNIRAVALQK